VVPSAEGPLAVGAGLLRDLRSQVRRGRNGEARPGTYRGAV